MKTIKTMVAASAMLFGMAQAQNTGTDNAQGSFVFTVERTLDIACNDADATTNVDDNMVLGVGVTDASNAAAEIVCTIETNYPYWNMEIDAGDGKLENVATPTDLFTTETEASGTLTFWGEFDAASDVRTSADKNTLYAGATPTIGSALTLSAPNDNIAEDFETGAKYFMAGAGLNTVNFTLKAGVEGSIVTAEPGTYTRDIDITLVTNVP